MWAGRPVWQPLDLKRRPHIPTFDAPAAMLPEWWRPHETLTLDPSRFARQRGRLLHSAYLMSTLLLVVGIALAVSFLCSILEAVLLSITHSYVAVLQDQGDPTGSLLARMRENIDEPIAAILTLNTIAHTVGAAMAGAIALDVFGQQWVAAFSAVLTFVILVFSEILPKTLGATWWQELAPAAARILRVMVVLMKPILVPLAFLNRLISPKGERGMTVSRTELDRKSVV